MKRRNLLTAAGTLAITTIATTASRTTANTKTTQAVGTTVQLDKDLAGYYVTPIGTRALAQPSFPAVIVIMEAFGMTDYIKSVCDRLAKAGYAALAPDFYQGDQFAYDNLDGAIAKLKTLKDDVVMAQFGKGIEFLAKQPNRQSGGIGVVGFCMGGRFTFLAAATHADQIKAGVAYYGGGISSNPDGQPDGFGRPDLLNQADKIQAPMMFMYGTEDQLIAADEHQRVALAMSTAKKSYAINVFAGAPHGFDSDRRANYNAAAAEEAWDRTLQFFDRHVKCK